MAEKKEEKKTTTTTTSSSNKKSASYFMSIFAYVAVVVGGLALFIAMILSKVGVTASFIGIMQKIANAIGWLVLCVLSFKYISKRRKIWMWVVWAIAVVMIIVGIVL
ncbi:MAG: hypothetical protein IJ538_00905 [Clostridia bacterium]|nr:hypothetical protein [Clostridia bacterium]